MYLCIFWALTPTRNREYASNRTHLSAEQLAQIESELGAHRTAMLRVL